MVSVSSWIVFILYVLVYHVASARYYAITGEPDTQHTNKEKTHHQQLVKTAEELLQEVDTFDNRHQYIHEFMRPSSRHNNTNKTEKHQTNAPISCYYSREGYWDYELCLYGKISQFRGSETHRNPNIQLGDFMISINVSKILMNDKTYPYSYLAPIYGNALFQNTERNFMHLLYTGGDTRRESLVTVQCSKASNNPHKRNIISISEPMIHHYHFTVIYEPICDYKYWLRGVYGIYEGDMVENAHSDDVSLLLSPLQDSACFLLKEGWWTLKLCYGQFIGQMHLKARGTEWDVEEEHTLGRWDVTQTIAIHKNEMDAHLSYASVVYDNGDPCDLNGQPRKTEIQFRCDVNGDHSKLISSRENPSCYYIVQVDTPLLCGHPDLNTWTADKQLQWGVCFSWDITELIGPYATHVLIHLLMFYIICLFLVVKYMRGLLT